MRCIIAEDHPLYREAITSVISNAFDDINISSADSFESLQALVDSGVKPDFILLDLCMPGAYGFSGLIFVRGQFPEIPVIIMSAKEGADVIKKASEYGASAFIPKSTPTSDIISTINLTLSGETSFPQISAEQQSHILSQQDIEMAKRIKQLSSRQFKILLMVTEGKLNKQIASELFISLSTVKSHMSAIMKILNVNTRTHAALVAKRLDIVEDIDLS